MPNALSGSIFSVQIRGKHDNQLVMLTLNYKMVESTNAPWNQGNEFTALNNIFDGVGDLFLAYSDCTSVDYDDWEVYYQVIKPTRYLAYKFFPTIPHGTQAGDSLPPNVAHAITMRADLAGKHNRGTKHIGGQPVSFTDAGMLTVGGLASLNGLRDRLQEAKDVRGDGTLTAFPVIHQRLNYLNDQVITGGDPQRTTRVERRRTVGLGK